MVVMVWYGMAWWFGGRGSTTPRCTTPHPGAWIRNVYVLTSTPTPGPDRVDGFEELAS